MTSPDTRSGLERTSPRALTAAPRAKPYATTLRARGADRELAAGLGRAGPRGASPSARYLDELGRRPVLPQAVERELVTAAQSGDPHARARLVEAFMPLIASVARLYRESPRIERMELLQEGVVGLLRALERYDATRGIPFWPYAAWWVRQAMQQLVAELTRPVVLSDRALRHLARVRDVQRRAVQETGAEPDRQELARRTGLSEQQVDDRLPLERVPRSTDEAVGAKEGAVGTFGDLLVDPLADGNTSACWRPSRLRSFSRCSRGSRTVSAQSCAPAMASTTARSRACEPSRRGWASAQSGSVS